LAEKLLSGGGEMGKLPTPARCFWLYSAIDFPYSGLANGPIPPPWCSDSMSYDRVRDPYSGQNAPAWQQLTTIVQPVAGELLFLQPQGMYHYILSPG